MVNAGNAQAAPRGIEHVTAGSAAKVGDLRGGLARTASEFIDHLDSGVVGRANTFSPPDLVIYEVVTGGLLDQGFPCLS